jgi:hypothetical protein
MKRRGFLKMLGIGAGAAAATKVGLFAGVQAAQEARKTELPTADLEKYTPALREKLVVPEMRGGPTEQSNDVTVTSFMLTSDSAYGPYRDNYFLDSK